MEKVSMHGLNEVLGLFTEPEAGPETGQDLRLWNRLGLVFHRTLVAGLILSAAMLFTGLALSTVLHQPVPAAVSGFTESIRGLRTASPAGFISLGILLLIATPVLRILGSLVEFIGKRDWRFACVTLLVLLILSGSLLAGCR